MELLYLLPLLLIALIIGAIYWYKKRQAQKLALLIESFGCPKEDTSCPPEILEQIAKYYEMAYPDQDEQSGVDQTTWEDLDMDSVFMALNHTLTSPGEEVLYAQLHHTTCGDQQLEELEKWMALFTQDSSLRGKAMLALQKLSKNPFHHSVDFLYHPSEKRLAFPALYVILALLPIVFAVAGIFQPYFFLLLIPSFLVNGLLHFRAGMKMQQQIGAVRYLSAITLCAKRLGRIGHPDLEPICQEIKQLLRPFQKITRLSRFFFATTGTDMDILLEYLKILFLTNEIVYLRLVGVIRKHSLLLRQMYELVGRLDMALAIASYRKSQKVWTIPTFGAEHRLVATALVHPLISQPVPNDLIWERNILLTGSNASGKSTFLKAVAVNAILAQTVHTATASGFLLPRCRVMTSMAIRDSIHRGESYFIAEIRSLKRLVNQGNRQGFALCFIDEILRGTNTVERIAASSYLLQWFCGKDMLCMAATHDVELTRLLEAEYANYHFSEEIQAGEIRFPYLLQPGPSQSKNAIGLLRLMGYDDQITRGALHMAEHFEHTGVWELSPRHS